MTIGKFINAFAGTVILFSLAMAQLHHEYWLYLTAFAGLNLFQSAFTGFCLPAIILKRMGMKSGSAF